MQVWFSTHLLNLLGMWPPVRSAGFAGPFTPSLALNSLSFKRIPCFCSSSSQGWVSQPGLGRSWVTAGSASPLPGTRSRETGGRGAGTHNQEGTGSTWRQGPPPRPPAQAVLGGGGGGVGTGLKVRTRALPQLPVPLSPGFQTPGPPSACQARPALPLFFQTQTKSPLSPCLQRRSRPGWGWEAGCQGKHEAPASSRWLPALPGSAHTHPPLAAVAAKRGSEEGGRGSFPGREECGQWVGLPSFGVGVSSQPSHRSYGSRWAPDLPTQTAQRPGNLQGETD